MVLGYPTSTNLPGVGEPCDGVLQVIYFLIKIILESIYFFVQGAFHIVNCLIQLHIDGLLLLYKISYHLAQI